MRDKDFIAAQAAWYASWGVPKEGFPPGSPPGSHWLVPQPPLQSLTASGDQNVQFAT